LRFFFFELRFLLLLTGRHHFFHMQALFFLQGVFFVPEHLLFFLELFLF